MELADGVLVECVGVGLGVVRGVFVGGRGLRNTLLQNEAAADIRSKCSARKGALQMPQSHYSISNE